MKEGSKMADPVEVVETYEEAQTAGYFGNKYDPRPNEDYTVQGRGYAQRGTFRRTTRGGRRKRTAGAGAPAQG